MGFLDNLEDSLKSLESQEDRDPGVHKRRQDEKADVLAVAPWAEKLKKSDYIRKLFDEAAVMGHRIRTKIYMAWFDTTLRLEARQRRLELRPTPNGIIAAFIEPDGEVTTEPLDLSSDAGTLIDRWLGSTQTKDGKTQ